jgi:hypothetical protein
MLAEVVGSLRGQDSNLRISESDSSPRLAESTPELEIASSFTVVARSSARRAVLWASCASSSTSQSQTI